MNKLFTTALARMTLLYVAVLAVVCVVFSSFIYTTASNEIDRTSRRQVMGFRSNFGQFIIGEAESEKMRQNEADEAKRHLRATLFVVNILVIGGGAFVCYWFARKTLEPIEDSVKAQERFTSDASHELRTPLASMKTEIEVALRDPKLSSKEAKELLESNLEEVNSLHVLTENLLHLARHRELAEMKPFDMQKVMKSVLKKYDSKMKTAGMQLTVESKVRRVVTNQGAIEQMIGILLDNSLKYAGEGTNVVVRVVHNPGGLKLTVADNGVGMSDGDMSRAFDRFYKADESRTGSRQTGHGLGLSIAKQLVGALHGHIAIRRPSEHNGVEFSIVLPCAVE